MRRFDQRQGFLVSAVIHLTLLMMLIAHPPLPRRIPPVGQPLPEARERVFLPPNSVLRRLVPLLPKATPAPSAALAPRPTPPPAALKDRVSVGPPSELRARGPMVLRRDDDLTKVAKGTPVPPAPPAATPPQAPPSRTASVEQRGAASPEGGSPGRERLRVPPSLFGREPAGRDVRRGPLAGPTREGVGLDRSLQAAVDDVSRRMQNDARLGIPTGTGRDVGGLYFDPQGADFTMWTQRFKDEVYRNWIVPQSALLGVVGGHVDFEFTIDRGGALVSVRLLKSTGTPALDRAAYNALTSSRYLPLPEDYAPPRLTAVVTFNYGRGPSPS